MAFQTKTCFVIVLLYLLSLLATTPPVAAEELLGGGATTAELNNINIADITSTLFKKGYGAMAVLLPQILEPYLSQPPTICNPAVVGTLTIFAPADFAFSCHLSQSYNISDVIRHQIVPFLYLPKADFYWKLRVGDTVDTLLPSAPLMFTPRGFDHVHVKKYGIYNDGRVIVHGVNHFFFDFIDKFYARGTDWTSVAGYKNCSRASNTSSKT